MAETAYYLDEEDRDFLNFLYEEYGRTRGTKTRPETRNPRARSPYQPPLEATHPGPRCYVALTPAGGIPALNKSGTTGTGTVDYNDDVPGEAECDIYRIDETPGTAGTALLEHIPGLTKTVYNIGDTAISGLEWVKVTRTESGAWVADRLEISGSSGDGDGGGLGDLSAPVLQAAHVSGASISSSSVGGVHVAEDVDTLLLTAAGWYQIVLNLDMTPASLIFSYVAEVNEQTYGGGPASGSVTFYGPGADNVNAFGGNSSSAIKAAWRLVVPGSNAERFSMTFTTFVQTTQPGVRFGIRLAGGGSTFTIHAQGLATPQNFTTSLTALRLHWHA